MVRAVFWRNYLNTRTWLSALRAPFAKYLNQALARVIAIPSEVACSVITWVLQKNPVAVAKNLVSQHDT